VSRKPIKDPVYKNFLEQREVEPAVWGSECAGCGETFSMRAWCNDSRVSELHGTFDRCAEDPETGRGLGNQFSTVVCSFACADKVMKGGWRDMPVYAPFAKADAALVRCDLTVTALVAKGEAEILADRERRDRPGGGGFYCIQFSGQERSVADLAKDLAAHEVPLTRIKELGERTGLSGDAAADVLWVQDQLDAALQIMRAARRPEGGSISIGFGGTRDTSPPWGANDVMGRVVDAAGLLADRFPESVGAGRPTKGGWRLVRGPMGARTLVLGDLLELLHECERLSKDDEEFEEHDVADRAEDGVSIARRLVEFAEAKLGYVRVLGGDAADEDD